MSIVDAAGSLAALHPRERVPRCPLVDGSEDTWVIGVSADWGMCTGGLVLTELFEQSVLQRRHVILDVSRFTFVDSTGLSQILQLARATAANKRALVLLRPTPAVDAPWRQPVYAITPDPRPCMRTRRP